MCRDGEVSEPVFLRFKRSVGLLVGIVAVALLVAACGGGGQPSASSGSSAASGGSQRAATSATASASEAAPITVSMKNFRFDPAEIRVQTGQKIIFQNDDMIQHNVVQATVEQGLTGPYGFESPRINAGESWEYTFNEAGEYPIICNVDAHHLAGMTATVIVE